MIQAPTRLLDLHAFSPTCPDATEVKAIMAGLGFDLEFELPAYRGTQNASPLPPQYHFKDGHGTSVVYLAGRDYGEEVRWIAPHASRWWLYAGNSQFAYNEAVNALKSRWGLLW